jgi:hypothetical protein
MGYEPNRGSIVTHLGERATDVVSGMLKPEEREVVRGDLTESGEKGVQALRDVLGLVVRRQAALWREWRPWAILVGLIIPLGMLLSILSRVKAGGSAAYIWLYANNWDWTLLKSAGFWFVLRQSATKVFISYLTLACWSWAAGFVLGSASRRRLAGMSVLLLCVMLLCGELAAPLYLSLYRQHLFRVFGNPPVVPASYVDISALTFYRVILPLILQMTLVAAPALWGMLHGAQSGRLTPQGRRWLCSIAMAGLILMALQVPGSGIFLIPLRLWVTPFLHSWVLQLAAYWPIAYLISNPISRGWRRIASPA